MWLTSWVLAASAVLYQPVYPPFRTKEDCEIVRQVYVKNRNDNTAKCVEVDIWINK